MQGACGVRCLESHVTRRQSSLLPLNSGPLRDPLPAATERATAHCLAGNGRIDLLAELLRQHIGQLARLRGYQVRIATGLTLQSIQESVIGQPAERLLPLLEQLLTLPGELALLTLLLAKQADARIAQKIKERRLLLRYEARALAGSK